MDLPFDESQFRALIKASFIEALREERGLFVSIMGEAMEDVGLTRAVQEGVRRDYVSEAEITRILESGNP